MSDGPKSWGRPRPNLDAILTEMNGNFIPSFGGRGCRSSGRDAECRLGRGPPGVPPLDGNPFDDADADAEDAPMCITGLDGGGNVNGNGNVVDECPRSEQSQSSSQFSSFPPRPQSSRCHQERKVVLPNMEGVPKAELYLHFDKFQKLDQKQLSEMRTRCYTTWHDVHNNPRPHEKRYTCVFSCPDETGERFACGNWKNTGGVINEDGVHWYQNTKLAEHAAAARALDCFSLRECHQQNILPSQRCQDAPYLTPEEAPPLPRLPEGVKLPDTSPAYDSSPSGIIDDVDKAKQPPKKALHDWYDAYWRRRNFASRRRRLPDKDHYVSWSDGELRGARYTAVFTCPWTSERFASGKWADDDRHLEELCKLGDDPEEAPVMLVWYKTKKEAENAAAGRAYDSLLYRDKKGCEGGDGGAARRTYCLELPYLYDATAPDNGWRDASRTVSRVLCKCWVNKKESLWEWTNWTTIMEDKEPIRYGTGEDGWAEAPLWRADYKQSR